MGRQAGLPIDRATGMSTHGCGASSCRRKRDLVVRAIIAAQHAGIDLKFDRAAANDLAGRDVLLAVQTSVTPLVISCPKQDGVSKRSLSAVAKDGVELLVGLKVTVRTDLDQLIGGATKKPSLHGLVKGSYRPWVLPLHIWTYSKFLLVSRKGQWRMGVDINTAFRSSRLISQILMWGPTSGEVADRSCDGRYAHCASGS